MFKDCKNLKNFKIGCWWKI